MRVIEFADLTSRNAFITRGMTYFILYLVSRHVDRCVVLAKPSITRSVGKIFAAIVAISGYPAE